MYPSGTCYHFAYKLYNEITNIPCLIIIGLEVKSNFPNKHNTYFSNWMTQTCVLSVL